MTGRLTTDALAGRLHAGRDDGLDGRDDGHRRQRVLAAEPVLRHLPGAARGRPTCSSGMRVAADTGSEGPGHGRRAACTRAAWSGRWTRTSRRCFRTRWARSVRIPRGRSTRTRCCPTTCASAVDDHVRAHDDRADHDQRGTCPRRRPKSKVDAQPGCPAVDDPLCGFKDGDARPHHEPGRRLRHLH